MKIDFDGIQAFVVIAELGGFSKAAEHLHVTQTALTRRVQKLESYLGLRLLDRTTRYVELTAVGREFLPQAKAIVGEMTLAVGRLKDMSKNARGSFTLACVPTMASHVLPAAIRRYRESHPGNRVRLIDTTAFEVRDAVLHGQAELGIGIPTERHPELLETPLLEDPLMFFCREEHPLSHREAVTWSDMRETELVVVSSMTATRVFMDYQLAKRGISLSGAYEVQHHATAISLVAAGVGTAILPASTLEEGARPGVCRIPLVSPVVKRRITLLRRKNSTLSPAANAFFELLKSGTP
ncbi:LysR family transcriptional regulator [Aromatoleum petrolei]|uniref:LysR family transcriptional regulator n=1 Tax=Aromatoleum petrolei TaxID=76116 RepID=A0ABX1MS87_9RHOO|nr:LysR family transcriptional regulator [Aromatoleum petrolei]NMF90842.1 LysR family transcriptional regulator [Aromatoleum petrolei]QTQ34581.1 Transcription regulator, LysR family [Aromatoleum petrolei]